MTQNRALSDELLRLNKSFVMWVILLEGDVFVGEFFLKPWPHHSSLDKTLRGNSAFGILKIASTMVGAGLTPPGLSWNPVKITFEVLDLYLAGFSSSSSCCIRSRKLWRFSSWSFSASSCVIPHPYLRTDQQCYRDLSFKIFSKREIYLFGIRFHM